MSAVIKNKLPQQADQAAHQKSPRHMQGKILPGRHLLHILFILFPGALGKRGYGYDVKNLLSFFKKILNQDTLTNVALIGVGNLGRALLNYNFKRSNNIRISCAFDINKEITGRILSGVPVYDMDDLKQQLSDQQITIAILTVPSTAAQKTTDEMVDAGVKGIMNFTPIRLSAPADVRVQNVDLATELQTLIYFLDSDKEN